MLHSEQKQVMLVVKQSSLSDECDGGGAQGSSVSEWGGSRRMVHSDGHDGLSSQSSVSGGKEAASPQMSVSSTLKEHDYIGLSEVSSVEVCSQELQKKDADLHLQETELRLGPLIHSGSVNHSNKGAPFQPKPDNGLEPLGIALGKQVAAEATEVSGRRGGQSVDASTKNGPVSGSKRVFAEALGGTDADSVLSKLSGANATLIDAGFSQLAKHPLLPPLYPWKAAKQGFPSPRSTTTAQKLGDNKTSGEDDGANAASAPVVGWPPVQSFRKNSLSTPSRPKKQQQPDPKPACAPAAASDAPLFVKVYMDGVSIGRKVDIKSHDSYEKLSVALEEMFLLSGQCASKDKIADKKLSFAPGSDYVLTYEDKDGDLMLVGDVPWIMFCGTVKRLRIMKGSDAIGLGVS